MASRVDICSQLLISTIRIADISNNVNINSACHKTLHYLDFACCVVCCSTLLNFPPFCTFLCRNNCNKMYNQTFFTYLTVLINSFLTANNTAKCRCVKTRSLRVTFSLHCCTHSAVMAFSHHVMHSNGRRLLNVACSRICSRPSTSLSRPRIIRRCAVVTLAYRNIRRCLPPSPADYDRKKLAHILWTNRKNQNIHQPCKYHNQK